MFTTTIENNKTYFTAEFRGVEYTAYVDFLGRWNVYSRRKALGRHVPGVKFFNTAAEAEKAVKGLRGLTLAIQMAS